MRKGDEGGVEEKTWMMTLVHIDVHVRARPIGVVGGAGRESNACFCFVARQFGDSHFTFHKK